MILRRATLEDKEKIFKWRNMPEIIKGSTLNKKVTKREHRTWFTHVLKETDTMVYIIFKDKGMVRFDRVGHYAVVSIYLLPEYRNAGTGTEALQEGIKRITTRWSIDHISAYIRYGNIASHKFFARNGFSYADELPIKNHLELRLDV